MSWKNNLLVVIGGIISFVVVDQILSLRYTPKSLMEVKDGIVNLQAETPHILAVSSSHGRSFHVLGEKIREATAGRVRLSAIPVESGRIKAMNWVLQNRARPLIEDASGNPRTPLSHLIFGITWWDTCRREAAPAFDLNVISRAWRWSDYLADVRANGVTSENRNFLTYRWRKSLHGIVSLVGARKEVYGTYGGVAGFAKALVTGERPVRSTGEEAAFMRRWQKDIESGHECFLADSELLALDQFIDYANMRGLDLTIVLFPLMPETITDAAQLATIEPFARRMLEYGSERGVRVIDMTAIPPIGPDDFLQDYDHLSTQGNEKFSRYALANELKFLLSSPLEIPEAVGE